MGFFLFFFFFPFPWNCDICWLNLAFLTNQCIFFSPSLQAGQMTQAGVLEHLKLENVALSQQLTETQHRSIKEKERIAAQLQNIEVRL